MISKEIIDKVQEETDIVALVSEFLPLEKSGKGYKGLCPFHHDTNPSFSVSTEKNIAMCMTCHEGGRPIKFYRTIKNISFDQAVKELAKRIGIDVNINEQDSSSNNELYELLDDAKLFYKTYLTNSELGEKVYDYLLKRSISKETINHFDLGYAPNLKDNLYEFLKAKKYKVTDMIELGLVKRDNDGSYYDFFKNRLIFPITNEYGQTIGFSARTLKKGDQPKYINSPETPVFKKSNVLYNLSEARLETRKEKQVIIFEGFFDVISAYQADIKNSIAVMGTAFTKEQATLIKGITNKVVLAFDGDDAGINATLNIIPSLLSENIEVEVLKLPNKLDPDDYIKSYGKEAFSKLIKNSLDAYEFTFINLLKNTNLTNSNEVQSLVSNVTKMLVYAKPEVVAIYRRKLANELNISETEVKIAPVIKQPILPVKQKQSKLPTRYVLAEKRLLILMIRSVEWHEEIESILRISDSTDITLQTLRTKLSEHYKFYESFDINLYRETLNQDELDYFLTHVQTDSYWTDSIFLEKHEIYHLVNLVKETAHYRRRDYLKSLIKEKLIRNEDIKMESNELSEVIKRIRNLKEDN